MAWLPYKPHPFRVGLVTTFSSSYTNRFRRLGGKKAQHIQGSHLSGYQTDPCVCEFDSLLQKRVVVVYAITDESGCYRIDRPPRAREADRSSVDPGSPIGI